MREERGKMRGRGKIGRGEGDDGRRKEKGRQEEERRDDDGRTKKREVKSLERGKKGIEGDEVRR